MAGTVIRGTAAVVVVLALASCRSSTDRRAQPVTTTRVAAPTSSSSSPSSTTVAAPTTVVTTRPATTAPQASPEAQATALFEAWTNGDRPAAMRVAQAEAVTALFARRWQATDGWSFVDCTGAAGSTICTWQRPGGQLLLRVQNATGGVPVRVAEVRFQP